ncbi:hypothetical protein VNI00_002357 [Paramarasmius palmivorus]|uniref:Uncharacterized protein n=1 Tax=Paramarasmius palmivorus TaxID=297713 RepID=A0AAW0E176_9AGAR
MGRRLYELSQVETQATSIESPGAFPRHKRRTQLEAPALGPQFSTPKVIAADPYTSAAFVERTGLPCSSSSFREIAEGTLPEDVSYIFPSNRDGQELITESDGLSVGLTPVIEMTVCSFALHLVESSSELFSLLWELSTKSRWLIVLAPHKKPEIKEGWGWTKWNMDTWAATSMSDQTGEILHER